MRHNDPRNDPDHDCLEAVGGDRSMLDAGRCPGCAELDRIDAERMHLMTRDRRVEPW